MGICGWPWLKPFAAISSLCLQQLTRAHASSGPPLPVEEAVGKSVRVKACVVHRALIRRRSRCGKPNIGKTAKSCQAFQALIFVALRRRTNAAQASAASQHQRRRSRLRLIEMLICSCALLASEGRVAKELVKTSMTEDTATVHQAEDGGLFGGKLKVAILGATGMVGQQFIRMLKGHPWFEVAALAASASSAGKPYAEAVGGRWAMEFPVPEEFAQMTVLDAQRVDEIAARVDVAFCAVNLDKESVLKLEHAYAASGVWVTSNNSAYRPDPFVPMVIPAVNPHHLDMVAAQRAARGYGTGAIIVKSNCSIQSYVIPLEPLREFGIEKINVHSEQAISGAGKTFDMWPEMEGNLIPLINGEEQKSETEPLKIWGQAGADGIVPASLPKIKAKCVRVSVLDGHTAYVAVKFKSTPTRAQILERWQQYEAPASLPSAPVHVLHYLPEPDRPQPRLDVMTENGMAVSIGQLSVDEDDRVVYFTALSNNTILGAAGGAVLATEAAIARKLVYRRVR
jgi:aspartate-semialdehyde dehydrogenase